MSEKSIGQVMPELRLFVQTKVLYARHNSCKKFYLLFAIVWQVFTIFTQKALELETLNVIKKIGL